MSQFEWWWLLVPFAPAAFLVFGGVVWLSIELALMFVAVSVNAARRWGKRLGVRDLGDV